MGFSKACLAALVCGSFLLVAAAVAEPAEEPQEPSAAVEPLDLDTPEPEPPELAADALDDPADAEARAAASEPAPVAPGPGPRPLGPIAYDAEGRQGRIHTVIRRDTLWDISYAYLGSPWVWPSVWNENDDIANPHLIYPGDRIWITDGEMRRLSAAEAEQMLANPPAAPGPEPEIAQAPLPPPDVQRSWRVAAREMSGLVSPEQLDAAASVVDAIPDRVFLSQGDRVYVGLGEARAAVGEQYTVFRTAEKVFDPDSGRLLGYHVDLLGWLELDEVHPESSIGLLRVSHGEVERGDRVMPREPLLLDVPLQPSPGAVEARIAFFASNRTLTAHTDFVYLNRGTLDGLEVGSPLEVYRPRYDALETARGERVEVPDRVVAELLVVRAQPESAVAYVLHSNVELSVGDHVRGATLEAVAAR